MKAAKSAASSNIMHIILFDTLSKQRKEQPHLVAFMLSLLKPFMVLQQKSTEFTYGISKGERSQNDVSKMLS